MLRLENIRKTFGALVAVEDLSLEIRQGEVFGLLGPNGAGKTTTINLAVGLLPPDRGGVILEGVGPASDPRIRGRIGVAPQSLALYDELSGERNVAFFARLYGLRGRRLAERVSWALEFVGLTERRGSLVRTYSGGMQRRLNLAIALVHDPPLLMLDEPTVGVDPQSRNAIFDRIRDLRQQGRTIVYTTHYMEEAQRLCDRVAIIDHGRLLACDTVEGLINTHGGKSVLEVEQTDGTHTLETNDPLADLNRLQRQSRLIRFELARPDLERVFLNLTGRHLRD